LTYKNEDGQEKKAEKDKDFDEPEFDNLS